HLNIKHPQNLAEKIAWLEYHEIHNLKVDCTDKWAVRDYVKSKGLEEILVPVYGDVYSSAEDLNFTDLPDQFVLKATHGCGMNLVCPDKRNIQQDAVLATLRHWLSTTFGTYSFEPHYETIPHRFYIEKYLGDGDAMVDYKFFCFHGKPSFVEVCSNRKSGLKLSLYDMDWNRLDAITEKRYTPELLERPKNFERMKEIAEILSEDFVFVRVDLYHIEDQIYFSELTFTPATCVLANFKEDFLLEEGKKLTLPSL
ncbi:MAG: glycosyltransferase, partial [Proteobacteria bacterium]|nr:glycosyltransferase [Pseudomonadota bacterium]